MANAEVLYAEDVSGAITAATTSWVDVCSIAAASFTASKNYLILANIVLKNSSSTNEGRARLVHGTTPTVFDDASLALEETATNQEHELSYLFKYAQPGTTELVKLQISSSTTNTTTCIFGQIIAINLDDLGADGTDYFFNEFLTNYTLTTTPTAKAITASFTPNGTDRWLFIGHMIYDVGATITTQIGFELYDSVAGVLNSCQQEGEDATNDFLGHNLYWVGVPTNAARTVAVRPFQLTTADAVMLASRVIAINLAKFAQSASAFAAAEVDPATSPTYTTLATVSPTPTNTGNWVYIGFSVNDTNEFATSDFETRLQVNPDGVGLVSDPNYPTTPPSIDGWDNLDELPFSVFKLRQLNSGASRAINWDCRQVAGTTGRWEDNGLVAFSVALATTGYTLNLESGSYAVTGQPLTALKTKLLSLAAGAYNLTGQAATLSKGLVLSLASGVYTLVGQNATQLVTRLLSLVAGNYVLTGQSVTLARSYLFNAGSGSYVLIGQAASLLVGRLLSLGTGSYVLTGQAITILAARLLSLNLGNYVVSGQVLSTLVGRQAALLAGSYMLTGFDANLIYTPVGAYTLNLAPGSFALTGQPLTPLVARLASLIAGSYLVNGQNALLAAGRLLSANAGSYLVTGNPGTLLANRSLALAIGSYVLTGRPAELVYTPLGAIVMVLASGMYTYVGIAATLVAPIVQPVTKLAGRHGGRPMLIQVLPYEMSEEYKRKKREEEALILLLTLLRDD